MSAHGTASGPESDRHTADVHAAESARREAAARSLERDLLTTVPLLYGSPGRLEQDGDPGVTLARVHREELVRRNGGGIVRASGSRSEVALPFERATTMLAVLLFLLVLLGR